VVESTKRLHNARKFAFLAQAYPEKTFEEVVAMFQLPAIDINCAVWQLETENIIDKITDKSAKVLLLHPVFNEDRDKKLDTDFFGPEVGGLINDIRFALENLARAEGDLEDQYFSNWTAGYLPHDLFTAMGYLMMTKQVSQYDLTSIMDKVEDSSVYTFYTLTENLGKEWGRSQFADDQRVESGDTRAKLLETSADADSTEKPAEEATESSDEASSSVDTQNQ
jgi:hypothetical protein